MSEAKPYHIKSIREIHKMFGFPEPQHRLISIVNQNGQKTPSGLFTMDFYMVGLNWGCRLPLRYGNQSYNFQSGVMYFIAPGQVFGNIESIEKKNNGKPAWLLYIHPDYLLKTKLAKSIKSYEYFGYAYNEALMLKENEENIIVGILKNIMLEYAGQTDRFTQDITIPHIEALLNYAQRFHNRQIFTYKVNNREILQRLDDMLTNYFNSIEIVEKGFPNVQSISEKLNLSPNYLSSMLKAITGRNLQQHIQDKMIEKAKEKISSTEYTVNEIAYELGFAYPQSFSRLFKAKTGLSPIEFRQKLINKYVVAEDSKHMGPVQEKFQTERRWLIM